MVVSFSFAGFADAKPVKKSNLATAVMKNLDMDLAREIILDLQNMGTATTIDGDNFGFRGAGSESSQEASLYVRDLMADPNGIGLPIVRLDEIPVDAWEFRGAWVDIPGLDRMQAASYGGSPGTDGEISGVLVDVGNGFHSDYEGKDVTGKIVLANWIGNDYWVDSMAMEAYVHEAKAIVVTTYDSDYGNTPGAIECHDGLYRDYWPPMISISGDDGLRILEVLEANPEPTVTVFSDIVTISMEDGGFGWNVVGILPGKNYGTDNDEFLILGDHTDAWFFGGMDDNSGVAATLVLADAFKKTADELKITYDRTLIFVTHEAEEYGILDTYYDWCYGANYQITHAGKDWVGKSVAFLCFELMGAPDVPLEINMAPELVSFVHKVLGQNKARLPYGFGVAPIPHCWADHWTYSAAGIPGIELATSNAWYDEYIYHNQFDTIDLIDFDYLQGLFEVFTDMSVRLITLPIIPYNFETSADQLIDTLLFTDDFGVHKLAPIYDKYGIDPTANMDRAVAAAMEFQDNAMVLAEALAYADPAEAFEINKQLLSVEAVLGQTLIAIGVWEQDWYPYQQAANDVLHMDAGISFLTTGMVSGDSISDALWELNWVGTIWYYDYMCKANYLDQYSKLCGAEVASWGLQTHLLPATEIWDEYDALAALVHNDPVTAEDTAWIVDSLQDKMVVQSFANLEAGFETMWLGLESANSQMDTLLDSL